MTTCRIEKQPWQVGKKSVTIFNNYCYRPVPQSQQWQKSKNSPIY
ncbi:hypothetical protein [Planktothrix sp. PCC 11201]|nr:hypothetical protein [Planktothrix sp. PCC 11201]